MRPRPLTCWFPWQAAGSAATMARSPGCQVSPLGRPGVGVTVGAPSDSRLGHLLEVPKALSGRLPRADRAGEVAIDQRGAAALRLHVGSTLALGAMPNGGPPGASATNGPARPRRLTERVVGILVTRGSVDPVTNIDKVPVIFASTALWHNLGPGYLAFDGAYVKLRAGATPGSFGRE